MTLFLGCSNATDPQLGTIRGAGGASGQDAAASAGGSGSGGVGVAASSGGEPGAPTGGAESTGGVASSAGGSTPSSGASPGMGGSRSSGGATNATGGAAPTSGGASGSGGALPGTGGDATGGEAADGRAPNPPGACDFSFTVQTNSYNGRYAPNNVGAIWIEGSDGKFVKTLRAWGLGTVNDVRFAADWMQSSQGNIVDAVTSATRHSHGPMAGSWTCMDTEGHVVPAGDYRACVEMEENRPAPELNPVLHTYCADFSTEWPFERTLPDHPPFTAMRLSLMR